MSFQTYVSLKGTKQGQIKGESKTPKRSSKWTDVVAVSHDIIAPYDPQSGSPKGPRTHKPVTITKEFGGASPQLLDAHWKNEVFSEVVIEVVEPTPSGIERVVKRITLTDAVIASVKSHVGPAAATGRVLSDFTFTYKNIQEVNSPGASG